MRGEQLLVIGLAQAGRVPEGGGRFAYRTTVPTRGVVVVNNGSFEVAA